MNLYADFAGRVRAIVTEAGIADAAAAAQIVVEPPRDPTHGDMATNAALVLAKAAGRKPRDIAEVIAERLRGEAEVASVEIAGPGFLNIRLAEGAWPQLLAAILAAGGDYGRSGLGAGTPVNVEYVSANPTGPMHVGHCRGAVFGDALASLMSFAGYDVTREYYINDAGAQVDVLARSAFHRYREALGEDLGPVPDGLYPGDYLVPAGVALAETYGPRLREMDEAEWLPIVREVAIDAMMVMIRADLASLAVRHDIFFSERSLTTNGRDRVAEAIGELSARGLIYEGRLEPPKGQLPDDWEDREQTLFRATAFGDDVDRALMKSDGSYTYFANDIAYHYDKILRGFDRMVDVWGADHGGYVKRMQAAVAALSGGKAKLDVRLCQLVRLFRAGEPVKMSKRAGTFVTLREVVEEVGSDAVRFMMLFRKNDAPLDFDFALVTEKSRENPVFYVQYAHARCASIFRQAEEEIGPVEQDPTVLAGAPLELLVDGGERGLVAKLLEWPRVVEAAAQAAEPHRIAFFLHELAALLHGHWNRGKEMPDLRFINAGVRELTMARLALVRAVQLVLATGLGLLGVAAVDEMR